MSDWMIFAERITTEMERQQLSIKQLADKIGMTTTTVSRYAKGERVPRASEIVRTADALGVTCDYLVGLSDNPHRINEQMEMISRQAAIDRIRGTGYADQIKENVIMILMGLPSEQPEIIRCKDCRWWDKYGDDNGYCMAAKHGYWSEHWEIIIRRTYKGDFYCADAEPNGEQE